MFYYEESDNVLEKYQVFFDREEIEKLKLEIIDKCSFIIHKEYESDYSPIISKNDIIKNFRSTNTGKQKEYFEETRDICAYSYDEYIPPYLVNLIDELLNGNSDAISKIINYGNSIYTSTIDEKLSLLNQEFNDINSEDITKRISKLKEIEELLKSKELNKNQQNIGPYCCKLLKLLSFKLIDSVSLSDINKMETFFDTKLYNKEKNYTKSLKKEL